MSARLLSGRDYGDIQLSGELLEYHLYIKGYFVETIKAHSIEEADTKAHQLHPHLTDDDYEIKRKRYNYCAVNTL